MLADEEAVEDAVDEAAEKAAEDDCSIAEDFGKLCAEAEELDSSIADDCP